ncbi:dynein assembly factor 6, axonemal-like [Rhagoletis pomonella]|uniref:dynein assembly factor 6, axonemal-like n=1 Tax=Rhagoletis pomonella TaxID=28610 RepID=UPI001781B655|nr:dynein assembly factor 6, axonemal-like [Rhagoletis pomonella]
MSLFENPDSIRMLRDLLTPPEERDNSDTDNDDEPIARRNNFTPANIGSKCSGEDKQKQVRTEALEQPVPTSIEEWQEQQERQDAEILETRKRPEYSMTYRQAVGTEDLYLQMGNRTNATASCEDLLLDILLPDETTPADKMDLSITEDEVDLATPIYRLKLPLPHKVNVDRCRAKYVAELRKLCLTLRLQREFDYVNF